MQRQQDAAIVRYLIPKFDGAIYSVEWKEALWARYATAATTTHAVRASLKRLQASATELSRSYGINPKTVLKWRKQATVEDLKTGPREPRSTVLSEKEEAIIIAFRQHRCWRWMIASSRFSRQSRI